MSNDANLDALHRAVGSRRGKMGRIEKREKVNKYASKAPVLDPFEQSVATSIE
jgi:hypothetical protein